MGIVYEAEQQSLRRRVALKLLPLAAVLASTQLPRLKNEAQAIVVGKLGADGVFYADELLLKCPTRYDQAQGATPGLLRRTIAARTLRSLSQRSSVISRRSSRRL